jgi:hypothetical protein
MLGRLFPMSSFVARKTQGSGDSGRKGDWWII